MTQLTGSTVLVVGASGVLGSLVACDLMVAGAHVIGTASSAQTLLAVDPALHDRLVCDLRDPHSIDEMVRDVTDLAPTLTGVIIASGVVAFGPARETPTRVFDQLMAINATGPINLINALTPLLSQASDAFVLTLSGKIAEAPTAGLAAYGASKIALYAYALAASREFRRDGIRWIDARPGHTETGLANRAIFGKAPAFGAGLDPHVVAAKLVQAIADDVKDLPSVAFDES
jgi:cyclic-di-GMP-binding biofilm dispersal mediator protein